MFIRVPVRDVVIRPEVIFLHLVIKQVQLQHVLLLKNAQDATSFSTMRLVTKEAQRQRVPQLKNAQDAASLSKMRLVTVQAQQQRAPRHKNVQDAVSRSRMRLDMTRHTKKQKLRLVQRRENTFTSVQDVAIRPAVIFLPLAMLRAQLQLVPRHKNVQDVTLRSAMHLVMHGTAEQ